MKYFVCFLVFIFITLQKLPKGFCYVNDISPTIQKELRYYSKNNFIGDTINGYEDNVIITTTKAATALKKVQDSLLKIGLSLKIFDAYRPQRAVDHFVTWAKVLNDTVMKQQYYPKIKKRDVFKLGYIATKSGHSRGSTVDLTIVDIKTNKELDMGSPFDFFGISSHVSYDKLTQQQKNNRLLLRKLMQLNGFRPYAKEWWHFTLRNEPFPKTYFNFLVK